MTRGAQRDRNRAKTEKAKAKTASKGNKEELSAVQRKERDATAMREKQVGREQSERCLSDHIQRLAKEKADADAAEAAAAAAAGGAQK
jgi:hypothetical protein